MVISTGSAEPAPGSGDARQAAHRAQEARQRQHAVTLVMLVTAVRMATDKRTLAGVIVFAIGLVAARQLMKQRGIPGLEWYRNQGRHESRGPA
jgi:ABC-type phosphate/phosphonate transport system permease subunit